jgi:hypothetical protein
MSIFVRLAEALPAGHDEAATALFIHGKDAFTEDTVLKSVLGVDAVRAAKRAQVGPTVAAVRNSTSSEGLAAHKGDSRVGVQRALAANAHTPQPTLEWLLQVGVRREDREVIDAVAHRVPPQLVFELLTDQNRAWNWIMTSELARSIVVAGDQALIEKALQRQQGNFSGLIIAAIMQEAPRDVSAELAMVDDDRLATVLATAVSNLGYIDDAHLMQHCLSNAVSFVSAMQRLKPAVLPLHQLQALLQAIEGGDGRQPNVFAMFSPDASSKHLFIEDLTSRTARPIVERVKPLLDIATTEEITTVVGHFVATNSNDFDDLLKILPEHTSSEDRITVLARQPGWRIRALLFGPKSMTFTKAEVRALVSLPETARAVADKLTYSPEERAEPWFDELVDAVGANALRTASSNRWAAEFVCSKMLESFGSDTEALVLAARLIHEGFVGTLQELIGVVLATRAA